MVLFSGILDKYGTSMSASDIETILMKYDIKDNGLFCYNDFLRHFVLTMKSREGTGTNLLGRQKQPSPKLQVCNTVNQLNFAAIKFRILAIFW